MVVASSDIWAGGRGVVQLAVGLGLSVVSVLVSWFLLFNFCSMFYLLSTLHYISFRTRVNLPRWLLTKKELEALENGRREVASENVMK